MRPAVHLALALSVALALSSGLGAVGCVAGRLPVPVSQRPLTLPAGEDQLILGLGGGVTLDSNLDAVPGGTLLWRHAFTDRLEWRFPLYLAYRLGDDDRQLALSAGTGVGFATSSAAGGGRGLVTSPDPRQPLYVTSGLFLIPSASLTGRLRLSDALALQASVDGRSALDEGGFFSPAVQGSGSVLFEPLEAVSAGVRLGAGYLGALPENRGPEFSAALPLWFHMNPALDLTLTPILGLSRRIVGGPLVGTAVVVLGFDLHLR